MSDGVVSMRFSDGTIFKAWDRLSLRETFGDPLGAMSFTATPPRSLWGEYNDYLKKGELVTVLLDDQPQGCMIIQDVDKVYGRKEGCEYNITCESVLAAAMEGGANPNYAMSSSQEVPISAAILEILKPYGFSEIFIDPEDDISVKLGKALDGSKSLKRKRRKKSLLEDLKHQDCQVTDSDTAYGFTDRICNRLGLFAMVDTGGRVLLVKPIYDSQAQYTIVCDMDLSHPGDRFEGLYRIHSSNRNVFSETVVRGQRNDKQAQTATTMPIGRVGVPGSVIPSGIPYEKIPREDLPPAMHHYRSTASPYKPKFYKDKKASDQFRCRNLCEMIHGMKAKNGWCLEGTLPGWRSKTGAVWTVNTLVHCVIPMEDIDEDLWIYERVLEMDRKGAARTKVKLLPRHSFVIGESPQ
jgi:hypothetical protein